jgi:hypothetical protein
VIKALLLTTLITTKISTAGKVHLVYLLANIAKFKNRKEVLNTIFLLKCGALIARLETQKSPAYARTLWYEFVNIIIPRRS